MCVQLLSEEDGKTDLLESARRIASDYSQKNLEMKEINIEYIDKSLKGMFHLLLFCDRLDIL